MTYQAPAYTMVVRQAEVNSAFRLAHTHGTHSHPAYREMFLRIADELVASEGTEGQGVVNAHIESYELAMEIAQDALKLTPATQARNPLETAAMEAILALLRAARYLALSCHALETRGRK